ncbi:branched-chain amino acid transport system permease protein [Pseudonocardia thermophila]|uniref:Branched-chain amino acid transport system permease protein n=1 Tax=Pseudonocardia thermophila TaxID=1848 RepID=A0A1M6U3U9_PSETH|nr:branched-chain amino acid ABC transporter ATP-binding protein/permease [Pseudonocardia thermophila]SHK63965.1 branched-chain amino acid transport system permease protein [Pseudonocardia thermophila]
MDYYEYLVALAAVNGLIAISYQHVLSSGIMQACQAALVGVGAYASAFATRDWDWPFLPSLLLAAAVTVALGVPLSVLASRLGEFFFAIATLGFAQVLVVVLYNSEQAGGAVGFVGQPTATTAPAALTFCGAALALLAVLQNSGYGHRSRGTAADPLACSALGIDVNRHRVVVFALGSALAGLAGGLYAHLVGVLVPGELGFAATVTLLVMVVLGGITTPFGTLLGAVVITLLPEVLSASDSVRLLIYAVVVLVLMIVRPRGLVGRRPLRAPAIEAVPAAASAVDRPAGRLEVSGIAKAFGGLQVLRDVGVVLTPGEIHGVIGPNGAGKTTFLNIVSGLETPDAGTVVLDGVPATTAPPHARARLGIARTFQHTRLFPELTCYENLLVAAAAPGRSGPVRTPWASRRDAARRAVAMLHRFGLAAVGDVPAAALPYGVQRRVEIARALVTRPRFLLLDEPSAGIPEEEIPALAALVRELADDGIGILMIEHNIPLVRQLCDSLSVINDGIVVTTGNVEECLSHPATVAAYLGVPEVSGA